MNEGKPTKAKWWSRPRPQGLTGEPESTGPAPGDLADTDGDFELARPAGRRAEDGGDYELRRPEPVPADGEPAGVPAGVPAGGAEDGVPATSAVPAQGGPAGSGVDAGNATSAVPAQGGPAGSAVDAGNATSAVPVDGAPKPLHDPDPYSTPPYGGPGPWAPAPPVQHPAATPAHGVTTADRPAMPGTPLPPPQGTPAAPPGIPG
ncbi:protease, partial [Streptomyces swartbergensis]